MSAMNDDYYNEIDPFAAQWLRNLIAAGHLPSGEVDERDIRDVKAADLAGFRQCHFFAGIGGWARALQLAGWPSDRPVWTGSCPCQPFSAAGDRAAFADERHLWPEWFRLIRECRPATILGEQVDGAIGHGWLDAVFADMEGKGYACGSAVLPACGVGAPHRRNRIWFVANANGRDTGAERQQRGGEQRFESQDCGAGECGAYDASDEGRVVIAESEQMGLSGQSWLAGAASWGDVEWLLCVDGKARPTQPGIFPLAHGVSGRLGKLRAYGNAIVPALGAEFAKAVMECVP
jgi:DNA (cytosine-5)-methyltransferase 1